MCVLRFARSVAQADSDICWQARHVFDLSIVQRNDSFWITRNWNNQRHCFPGFVKGADTQLK